MKISIYVHDFHSQVGHTRALIELLNSLLPDQKDRISCIEVVSFSAAPLDLIFPEFACNKKFHRVPFSFLKPWLIKIIFYHIYSLLHSIVVASKHKKIGIGIACLNVDIVNIQFIHKQWEEEYFQSNSIIFFKKMYKKIKFLYFSFCEGYIYSSKKVNIKYIVIANFMKKYLMESFGTREESLHLIPSGVNLNEFKFSSMSSDELFTYLLKNYPQLQGINPELPISLFVGAYERKGLATALEALSHVVGSQFIIIGKPERFSNLVNPTSIKSFVIDFTNEVQLFYELADQFIFPTKYEPFGLVIIEAYVMGIDLIIPNVNVGASEIIPESNGIYFINPKEKFKLPSAIKISKSLREERRIERIKNIQNYSWASAGKSFSSILFK